MSLTITTTSGSRTIDTVRVTQDETQRALRGELHNGRIVPYGDRGKQPAPLVFHLDIQAATTTATVAEVKAILADAEEASVITYARGDRSVDGLVWHELRHSGPRVVLALAFAPSDATLAPMSSLSAGHDVVANGNTVVAGVDTVTAEG